MTTIKTRIKGRRLELDIPADWPDGIEVEIYPITSNDNNDLLTPEEIASTLAAMDRIVPFEMSDAEQTAWDTELKARRIREKKQFAEQAEKLRGAWE